MDFIIGLILGMFLCAFLFIPKFRTSVLNGFRKFLVYITSGKQKPKTKKTTDDINFY